MLSARRHFQFGPPQKDGPYTGKKKSRRARGIALRYTAAETQVQSQKGLRHRAGLKPGIYIGQKRDTGLFVAEGFYGVKFGGFGGGPDAED